jgi:hypothetical protein
VTTGRWHSSEAVLRGMLDRIRHRGPDDYAAELGNGKIRGCFVIVINLFQFQAPSKGAGLLLGQPERNDNLEQIRFSGAGIFYAIP